MAGISLQIKGGIWLVSALGGQPRRLTEFGARPAWSPDGSQIVFQSADAGAYAAMEVGAPPDSTIWTVAVADGTLHQITHPQAPLWPVGPSAPQWSPDGKRIIFSNADGIWRVDPSSGAASSVLASGFAYDAIFAPNGRSIFFSSADNEGPSIWMISVNPKTGAAVGRCRKLHNLGAAVAHNLAVSPDGRHLLFSGITTFDNLYSVTLDASGRAAGSPTALTHDTRLRKALPAISPDGHTVAFDVLEPSSPFQIWTVGSDGRNAQKVSSNGGIFPSWLPTGDLTWVANALDAKGPMPLNNSLEILARDHTSGAIHKIGWGPNKMGFARLSPDGKRIAYQTTDGGVINVWTVRVSDGTQKQITAAKHSVGWPCWSPDGRLLAVEEKIGEDTQIDIVSSEGGAISQLTRTPAQSWPWSWAPDGDRIVFAGFRQGQWNLYSVSRTTGRETQITRFSQPSIYVRYPEWSPTGKQIVFEYGESTGNIWLLDLE